MAHAQQGRAKIKVDLPVEVDLRVVLDKDGIASAQVADAALDLDNWQAPVELSAASSAELADELMQLYAPEIVSAFREEIAPVEGD